MLLRWEDGNCLKMCVSYQALGSVTAPNSLSGPGRPCKHFNGKHSASRGVAGSKRVGVDIWRSRGSECHRGASVGWVLPALYGTAQNSQMWWHCLTKIWDRETLDFTFFLCHFKLFSDGFRRKLLFIMQGSL